MAREEKATTGLPVAIANPLAVAMPTLSPVKDPGPRDTAMASKSSTLNPEFLKTVSSPHIRLEEWFRSGLTRYSASSRPETVRATLFVVVEVSIVRIFTSTLSEQVSGDIVVKSKYHESNKQHQSDLLSHLPDLNVNGLSNNHFPKIENQVTTIKYRNGQEIEETKINA
jgi:hypothetical protein